METIKNNFEAVRDYLNSVDTDELVRMHNQYCENCNDPDGRIESNDDEFFETFFSGDVVGAVRAIAYGNYYYMHGWIKFNGYANLVTSDDPAYDWIDISEIAADILESPASYDIELEDDDEE